MSVPNPPVPFGQMTEAEELKTELLRLGVQPSFFQSARPLTTGEMRGLITGIKKLQAIYPDCFKEDSQ